jgi:uncharacterized protein
MIVYEGTKEKFSGDILSNQIEFIISEEYFKKTGNKVALAEINSWKNSMQFMDKVIADSDIPSDCGICIEYKIPQTTKRIDFIITGQDDFDKSHAIIIELKQWQKVDITDKDALVITRFKNGQTETSHPSYQAWSYAALMEGFNEEVYLGDINLKPCAYLHNYRRDGLIDNEFYKEHIDKAPLFLMEDAQKLRNFIKQFVKFGDKKHIMYRIDHGKIRPSKVLADSMASMLKGNNEFVMIDDQKIVFENALRLARISTPSNKNVLIVNGGPGTGKSVVAINLLVELTKRGILSQYVSKNAAPRAVYESKLTGTLRRTEISNMFSGSGSYINIEENSFGTLIVDEAHRLNEKSGLFRNQGENQIKELMKASKFSIFFIDEDQKVTFHDIGTNEEIKKWAKDLKMNVTELSLNSQFRCNGSDGYLAWLDNTLQIRETANEYFDIDFNFQIVDTPEELQNIIFEKNMINNKARMVAGYCWDWISKKNKNLPDIVIGDNFKAQWNLLADGNKWIISPSSVKEVGCIHTCQGLEVDYVGVIVGDDLIVRNGKVITNPSKRARTDQSLKGYGVLSRENKALADEKADLIIKNTYRTLMTRGMKGCYVYFADEETREYFKHRFKPRS